MNSVVMAARIAAIYPTFQARYEDETGQTLVNPHDAEFHLDETTYSIDVLGGENSKACEVALKRLEVPLTNRLGLKRNITCRETVIPVGEQIYVMGNATNIHQGDPQAAVGHTTVLGSGRDHLFLISNEKESDLLESLTWGMNLCLFGGPLVTTGCLLWMMRVYF